MFYTSLYDARLKALARAQQHDTTNNNNGQSQVLPPNAQQQQLQQQQQPQISTQFLEAVARGGNSMNMLNDQQRRALEGRKPTGSTPTNQIQNQNQNQIPDQIRQPQSDIGVLQAMRQNPKMAAMWVSSKERLTVAKSRKSILMPTNFVLVVSDKWNRRSCERSPVRPSITRDQGETLERDERTTSTRRGCSEQNVEILHGRRREEHQPGS